jgi:hypothetical protein
MTHAALHISLFRLLVKLAFGLAVGGYEALIEDESDGHTDGEGPAAEPESKDFVVPRPTISAREFVEGDDIAAETNAEGATEQGPWLEGGGANAVIVAGNLFVVGQIQRAEHAPDVGAPNLSDELPVPSDSNTTRLGVI